MSSALEGVSMAASPSTVACDDQTALERIEDAWLLTGKRRWVADLDLFAFKRVAVIAGSSRGGTSLLHALLQRHGDIVSLDGEHTPYYKLAGIGYPRVSSDRVERGHPLDKEQLARLLAASVGTPALEPHLDDWADRLRLRLPLQPPLQIDPSRLNDTLRRNGNDVGSSDDVRRLFVHLGLHDGEPCPDPLHLPERQCASPPCPAALLEEPPYIFPQLYKRPPNRKDLEDKVLLLKASVDAYRLEWLVDLFAGAEITVIHETRNPAASTNGLIDGWRSRRGFYSCDVGGLDIEGYRDLHPTHRRLWCFDLPPDWRAYRNEPLERVCAHQWEQAHRHILAGLEEVDSIRLRFEDLIHSGERRGRAMDRVCRLLRLGDGGHHYRRTVLNPPKVMASKKPARSRWRRQEQRVLDAVEQLDQDLIAELCGARAQWI